MGSLAPGLARVDPQLVTDFAGSLPGRLAFSEGRAAAAILLRRELDPALTAPGREPVEEFWLASVVVVVATHRSNRLESLTLEQLANAFAKDARTPARNWNDLEPSARSELMTPAVCSPPGSLVLEAFQGIVLEGQPFRSDVRQRVEPSLAVDLLASRAGAVLLLPHSSLAKPRVLAVADGRAGKSSTAYAPSEANVHNGDYPLQLPLILTVRKGKMNELRPALVWLFSDEAAALLEKQGLYPAPKSARTRFVQRLDTR